MTLHMLLLCVQSEKIADQTCGFRMAPTLSSFPTRTTAALQTTSPFQHATDFGTLTKFVFPDPDTGSRLFSDGATSATTNTSTDASSGHIIGRHAGRSATFYSADTLMSPTPHSPRQHTLKISAAQGARSHEIHLTLDVLAIIIRNLFFFRRARHRPKSRSQSHSSYLSRHPG